MPVYKKIIIVFIIAALMLGLFCLPVKADKPKVLNADSPGSRVNIENYIEKGKTTIFDFYAEWCSPCKNIAPYLEKLNGKNDIVVYKIDIKNWSSPVCLQHNIHSVPNFKIYGPDGKLKYEGKEAYKKVIEMLKEG